MRLITNIEPPFLSDIIFTDSKKMNRIKATVAYCKDYSLFDYCKKKKIKLDYFGRLDTSVNLNLKILKKFSQESNISIQIIGGSHFHPKVIWCEAYGAYIGSANLTQLAWGENIECGLWLSQKELEDNDLTESLNKFFKCIKEQAKPLTNMSDQDISKLERNKSQQESQRQNELSTENFLIIKENFGIFRGCQAGGKISAGVSPRYPQREVLNIKNQPKEQKLDKTFYTEKAEQEYSFWNKLVKKDLEKRKEMSGLKMSEPLGKDRNSIQISLEPIGYKNHIRAFRTGKSAPHHIGVYYGFKDEDKEYYDRLKKEKMSYLIEKNIFKTGPFESWSRSFNSTKYGGTDEKDKQWIIDRIIDLLKTLKNINQK